MYQSRIARILSALVLFIFHFLTTLAELDLDSGSVGNATSLTYLFIDPTSSIQLVPSLHLTLQDFKENSATVQFTTDPSLPNPPCFSHRNTPPCVAGRIEAFGLSLKDARQFIQDIYYNNSDAQHLRTVVVTVTVLYETTDNSTLNVSSIANVLEVRDRPVLSTRSRYAPVYQHELRPVQFLEASNFTLTSVSGFFTTLIVCVFTQTNLETLAVDSSHPLIQSPLTINRQDSICREVSFNPIDNATLLSVFSAFHYSENIDTLSNLNSRLVSLSVHSEYNKGDPLYFNITYHTLSLSPISIQASPVVYYERNSSSLLSGSVLSIRLSDFISVQRQFPTVSEPITSLRIDASTSHIPQFNIWNNEMCTSNVFTHPFNKFDYCSDQIIFKNQALNSLFINKFESTSNTISVENRNLVVYSASREESYGFVTLSESSTQDPDANHFSLWLKNSPGRLTGCPLEIINGLFVDYQICLSGSESVINFIYTGLAPENYFVTVSYPTEGVFRVNDWNFVSVSVRMNSISFLLNGKVLLPSGFLWRDSLGVVNTTEIPVHLYSTSSSSITSIYILGRVSGFIGEVTGVIVDQFHITPGEAHCMFSCVEGFYMNETTLNGLIESGIGIALDREFVEVTGTLSLTQVRYILENLYHYTPSLSSNTYRLISVNVSDAISVATSMSRISYECFNNACFNNSFCFVSNLTEVCECLPGFFDISGNSSVCKHPMDCSYMNGGCGVLETCIQSGENIRECVDACRYSPCLNGGVCTPLSPTEYNCACDTGFYGAGCECRNSCLTQNCSIGECVSSCDGSFQCVFLSTTSTISTVFFTTLQPSSVTTTSQIPMTSQVSTSIIFATSAFEPVTSDLPSSVETTPFTSSMVFTPIPTTSQLQIPVTSSQVSVSSLGVISSLQIPITSSDLPTSSVVLTPTPDISMQIPITSSVVLTPTPDTSSMQIPITSSDLPTSSLVLTPTPDTSMQIPITSSLVLTPTPDTSMQIPITSSDLPTSSLVLTPTPDTSMQIPITSSDLPTSSVVLTPTPDISMQIPITSSVVLTPTPDTSSMQIPIPSSDLPTSSLVLTPTPDTSMQIPITSSDLPISFLVLTPTPDTSSMQIPITSDLPTSSLVLTPTPDTSSMQISITSSIMPTSLVISQSISTAHILSSSSFATVVDDTLSTFNRFTTRPVTSFPSIVLSNPSQTPTSAATTTSISSSLTIIPPVVTPTPNLFQTRTTSIKFPPALTTTMPGLVATSSVLSVLSSSISILPSSSIIQPSTESDPIPSSDLSSSFVMASTSTLSTPIFSSSISRIVPTQTITNEGPSVMTVQVTTPISSSDLISSSTVDFKSSSVISSSTSSTSTVPLQATTSQVEQVTTSSIPIADISSSLVDIFTSSESIQPTFTLSQSDSIQSTFTLSQSESIIPSTVPSSSSILPTSSSTPPPTVTGTGAPTESLGIAIGIAFGVLLVIIVVIIAITVIVALFIFRRSYVKEHDPLKDFDDSEPVSPAQITAVYKNEGRSLI